MAVFRKKTSTTSSAARASAGAEVGTGEDRVSLQYLTQSLLSARAMLARGLGQMFGGARNLYETFGYAPVVSYDMMIARYGRQDIVSRIVNAYPDAIWTRPPVFLRNGGLGEALGELNEEVSLWHYVNRADRLCGIGKYSLLFLGFDDAQSGNDLANPVRLARESGSGGSIGKGAVVVGGRKLAYVQAYGYGASDVVEWETNGASPYFGMPKVYSLKLHLNTDGKLDDGDRGQTVLVHRDRVIHIADCPLDNEVDGYPIMERVYNRLDDIEKVIGGSAEMFWLNGRRGLHVDVDKETQFDERAKAALRSELEAFQNDLQRVIRTRGVTIKDLGAVSVNPEPVFNVIMSVISVATGIPQRIFIGSEQGKLASEQDRANWAIRINERRELFAEPKILRPMVKRLQAFGVLPAGRFGMEWPEAFQMSPLERAQTAAQQARSATNIVRAMQDYAKPIEGVDYAISRPTSTVSGGGVPGSGRFGADAVALAVLAAVDAAKSGGSGGGGAKKGALPVKSDKAADVRGDAAKDKDKGADTGSAPAPKPIVVPNEEIKIARREIVSEDQARSIIFARGELMSKAKVEDGAD